MSRVIRERRGFLPSPKRAGAERVSTYLTHTAPISPASSPVHRPRTTTPITTPMKRGAAKRSNSDSPSGATGSSPMTIMIAIESVRRAVSKHDQ